MLTRIFLIPQHTPVVCQLSDEQSILFGGVRILFAKFCYYSGSRTYNLFLDLILSSKGVRRPDSLSNYQVETPSL